MIVEVCANSLQSALNAQSAGADRIELCCELAVGGITPSYGLLKKVREQLKIPVYALIRPRSGDFTYSDPEFQTMREDISLCVKMGFDGIVAGVLKNNFEVDWERTKILVEDAGPLYFTFHRAFDWVKDPLDTFSQLQEMGVQNVLTSGQATSAILGMPLLKELMHLSKYCNIMPGGGIRESNAVIFKEMGFNTIHLSGTRFVPNTKGLRPISMNSPDYLSETEVPISDVDLLRKVIKSVK